MGFSNLSSVVLEVVSLAVDIFFSLAESSTEPTVSAVILDTVVLVVIIWLKAYRDDKFPIILLELSLEKVKK